MSRLRITRRLGQTVVLTVGGVRFKVKVSDIDRSKVGLLFEAPPEVQINREEVQAELDAITAGRLTDAKPQ